VPDLSTPDPNDTKISREADDLKAVMEGLTNSCAFVEFIDKTDPAFDDSDPSTWLGCYLTRENGLATVTDQYGESTVEFAAWGKEAVKIVVVPEYPNDPQIDVVPEVTSWNFQGTEFEVVPQIRWVGEKIVLEKYFTNELEDYIVNFKITAGEGTLAQVGSYSDPVNNGTSDSTSVWTEVGPDGVANVLLTSDTANQVTVRAYVYDYDPPNFEVAQQGFTVYFLKFESLALSDVPGKRADHNDGVWTEPYNPYNGFFPYKAIGVDDTMPADWPGYDGDADMLDQTLNVSQDALERAQVKGWFMGVNDSSRLEGYIDADQDGTQDFNEVSLPAHRWVMPDDWLAKAGGALKWQTRRPLWDIMDSPSDDVDSTDARGPFAGMAAPVVGPFAPGIEKMTSTGWSPALSSIDSSRPYKTVVPNGELDAWDAPMPPAKVIFEIMEGNGYFKETYKTDIYVDALGNFTSPFYYTLIPAHWAIPAFIDEGGYEWNSFNSTYGQYAYWTVINQPDDYTPEVPSTDMAGHPTVVEVYSDNHGEAMVYLNGDWNLDLDSYNLIGSDKTGADIKNGEEVGKTTVQATVDYPYIRVEDPIASNTVEKTWTWGGMVLGIDEHQYANYNSDATAFTDASRNILSAGGYTLTSGNAEPDDPVNDTLAPNGRGYSPDKMVFIWARDRDGQMEGVIGTKVSITINPNDGPYFNTVSNGRAISQYNWVTKGITLDALGFLSGTNGYRVTDIANGGPVYSGYCYMRAPTLEERVLFYKNWASLYPIADGDTVKDFDDPIDFAVAGFDLFYNGETDTTVNIKLESDDLGFLDYQGNPMYPGSVAYTTNVNFGVSSNDSAPVIYPLDDPIVAGDANNDGDVNAADIIAIERIIMELDAEDVNADSNSNGKVNMGDVVDVINKIRKN